MQGWLITVKCMHCGRKREVPYEDLQPESAELAPCTHGFMTLTEAIRPTDG